MYHFQSLDIITPNQQTYDLVVILGLVTGTETTRVESKQYSNTI